MNLASRITAIARPGSLLAEREVRESRVEDAYRWSYAGERRLRGIREPVPLFRAAPAARCPQPPAPRRPQVVEGNGVLVGVHALPEALVAVGAQLAGRRQALQRRALEHAVGLAGSSSTAASKQKKPPLIQCSERRLLAKAVHTAVVVELGDAELQLRAHDGHARQRTVLVMEAQQRVEIDVREPVGVGRAEQLLAGQPRLEQLDAPARLRLEAVSARTRR